MYQNSIVNMGNYNNLLAAMKKAANGEKITIATIGGSITQGSSAINHENCYAERFFAWWKNKFADGNLEFVNAGLGGTDSYLGVHRMNDELLAKKPDVVIVEFAVNDSNPDFHINSYDSLVRKILLSEQNPAVILLFTTMEDGTNLQETHSKIGKAYDLPMLSYRDHIMPKINSKEVLWSDISPDNIHPNDAGHEIVGGILYNYLDMIFEKLADFNGDFEKFEAPAITSFYYEKSKFLLASDIVNPSMNGVKIADNDVYYWYKSNFVFDANGELEFTVDDCKNVGLLYVKMTDGSLGAFDVFADGKLVTSLDGDFTGGWGNYGVTEQIVFDSDKTSHKIKIVASKENSTKGFIIMRVLTS